jgi:hypothetical protein
VSVEIKGCRSHATIAASFHSIELPIIICGVPNRP